MKVREIMTRDVEVVRAESTVQEAARKMKELDIGPLPVLDGEKIVGMLTDRDITVRAVAAGDNPMLVKARDVMTPGVTFCFEDQEVAEAARIMKEKQLRRLPVFDRDHRLVGILALGDVAVQAGDDRLTGETLEGVSEPAESRSPDAAFAG